MIATLMLTLAARARGSTARGGSCAAPPATSSARACSCGSSRSTAVVAGLAFLVWFVILEGPAPTSRRSDPAPARLLPPVRGALAGGDQRASCASAATPSGRARSTEVQPLDLDHAGLARAAARRGDQRRHLRAAPRASTPTRTTTPLRAALADRHGVAHEQVAPGHGAGELLHAAFGAIAAGGRVAIAWPGWSPLPRLVHEAGAAPVPVAADRRRRARHRGAGRGRRRTPARSCSARPNDPTGAAVARSARRCAERLAEPVWLVVDAALAELGARRGRRRRCSPRASACSSSARSPRRTRWRACAPATRSPTTPACSTGSSPAGGVSAPAQAAMLWAVARGRRVVAPPARRRRPRARAARRRPARQPVLVRRRPRAPRLALLDRGGRRARSRAGSRRSAIYVTPGAAVGRRGARADRAARRRRHRPPGAALLS